MLVAGAIVPLTLQLADGNEKARVYVKVLDPNQEIVFASELLHVGGGLYQVRSFAMPEVDFVVAQYWVDGKTSLGGEYERVSETFERLAFPESPDIRPLFDEYAPKKDDFYIGKITEVKDDEFITGVMCSNSSSGY